MFYEWWHKQSINSISSEANAQYSVIPFCSLGFRFCWTILTFPNSTADIELIFSSTMRDRINETNIMLRAINYNVWQQKNTFSFHSSWSNVNKIMIIIRRHYPINSTHNKKWRSVHWIKWSFFIREYTGVVCNYVQLQSFH